MNNYIVTLIVFLILTGCKNKTPIFDYFGQSKPDTIPVIFAPDIISISNRLEHGISFTPDAQELAFGIFDSQDFSGLIYYSKKQNEIWSEPEIFKPLKDSSAYLPYFTPDGKSLLYAQSRPDTNNGITDIWLMEKTHNNWGEAKKLNHPINSGTRESTACMTIDRKVYFSSNRNGNGLADLYVTNLENLKSTGYDKLNTLSTVRDEESIFVSPDETYVIFCRYTTNKSGPDLFISYRNHNNEWNNPIELDAPINSDDWERRPFVSFDNKFLFFTRMKFSSHGLTESDIYWVNTTKMFKPFVFNPIKELTLNIGEPIKIILPNNFFMDINDENLTLKLIASELEGISFNVEKNALYGTPRKLGEFKISISAQDSHYNKTTYQIKLNVVEK